MSLKAIKIIIFYICAISLISCSTTKFSGNRDDSKEKIAKINIQLGMMYLDKQDISRAKTKFLHAIAVAPYLPEAWYSMGYFQEVTLI